MIINYAQAKGVMLAVYCIRLIAQNCDIYWEFSWRKMSCSQAVPVYLVEKHKCLSVQSFKENDLLNECPVFEHTYLVSEDSLKISILFA